MTGRLRVAAALLTAFLQGSAGARAAGNLACTDLANGFAAKTGAAMVGYTEDGLSARFTARDFGEVRLGCPPAPVVWAFYDHGEVEPGVYDRFAAFGSAITTASVRDVSSALGRACERALDTPHARSATVRGPAFAATCEATPDARSFVLSVAVPQRDPQ